MNRRVGPLKNSVLATNWAGWASGVCFLQIRILSAPLPNTGWLAAICLFCSVSVTCVQFLFINFKQFSKRFHNSHLPKLTSQFIIDGEFNYLSFPLPDIHLTNPRSYAI